MRKRGSAVNNYVFSLQKKSPTSLQKSKKTKSNASVIYGHLYDVYFNLENILNALKTHFIFINI